MGRRLIPFVFIDLPTVVFHLLLQARVTVVNVFFKSTRE